MGATAAERHLRLVSEWMLSNCGALRLDGSSIRFPRPNVVSAVTEAGQLLCVEVSVYEPGRW